MITIALICEVVCEDAGTNMTALRSERKDKDITLVRHVVMWLACELTEKSTVQIGRQLARDHTTVLYGFRRITGLRERDGEFRAHLDALVLMVKAAAAALDTATGGPREEIDPIAAAQKIVDDPAAVFTTSKLAIAAIAAAAVAGARNEARMAGRIGWYRERHDLTLRKLAVSKDLSRDLAAAAASCLKAHEMRNAPTLAVRQQAGARIRLARENLQLKLDEWRKNHGSEDDEGGQGRTGAADGRRGLRAACTDRRAAT